MIIKAENLMTAVKALQSGEVVAIPTETVYGLAADITIEKAVQKIFSLKGRPENHPLIIHIDSIESLALYAIDIPDYAYTLAKAFWPGPLSLVLKKSSRVSDFVTGGQSTVAVRMPNHPLTLSLISQVGHPLAAPSANKFGKISPTQVTHVVAEFGEELAIVEGEACAVGIESTIVDATAPKACSILRPGSIALADIASVLGPAIPVYSKGLVDIRVSGNLKSHYAPTKPTYLFSNEAELATLTAQFPDTLYVLYFSENYRHQFGYGLSREPREYAKALYQALRLADNSDKKAIAIEMPQASPDWAAICDRLGKCSANANTR